MYIFIKNKYGSGIYKQKLILLIETKQKLFRRSPRGLKEIASFVHVFHIFNGF